MIGVQGGKASSVRSPNDCGVIRKAGNQDFRDVVISGLENWLIGKRRRDSESIDRAQDSYRARNFE